MFRKIKQKLKRYWRWFLVTICGVGIALAAPVVLPDKLVIPPDASFVSLEKVEQIGEKFKIKVNEDPTEEMSIEIGGDKANFKPAVKLKKWGDETWFKVKYPTAKKIKPKQDKGKLKWKDKNVEVHFETTKDAFKFIPVLKKKPKTNVIELEIESEGLDFYYQPAVLKDYETYLDRVLDIVLAENPETVLDFGGGTGELAKQLIENGVKATVNDISQEAYDNRVVDDFILGDIFDVLPTMADDSYDLIIDVGVLKYIEKEKADELVAEIKRVSKKSIHFLGAGSWNPSDVAYLEAESNYTFWNDKFSVGGDEADVYKLSLNYRPENVVGSYAVYHSTKQGDYSQIGGKNYRAGKFAHIERPRLKDSNGWEVWGDLFIDAENGIYRITIPIDFYENAVYPIRSNDTFGYSGTPGSSQLTLTAPVVGAGLYSSSGGTGVSMSFYGYSNGSSAKVKMALYDASKNLVANGTTNEGNSPTSAGWTTMNFTNAPTLTNQNYYLALSTDGTSPPYGNYLQFYGDSTGGTSMSDNNTTYGTWNDPIEEDNSYSEKLGIYCTYTAAAAGTNMKINIGDAWKDVDSMKINIGDVWKDVEGVQINIGDSWKTVY